MTKYYPKVTWFKRELTVGGVVVVTDLGEAVLGGHVCHQTIQLWGERLTTKDGMRKQLHNYATYLVIARS